MLVIPDETELAVLNYGRALDTDYPGWLLPTLTVLSFCCYLGVPFLIDLLPYWMQDSVICGVLGFGVTVIAIGGLTIYKTARQKMGRECIVACFCSVIIAVLWWSFAVGCYRVWDGQARVRAMVAGIGGTSTTPTPHEIMQGVEFDLLALAVVPVVVVVIFLVRRRRREAWW